MESASTVSNGSGGGGRVPAPIPAVNGPPPFLVKTYEMVDDSSTDKIVSWSSTDNSFVVWDSAEFAKDLLPKYFKHNNFSSFVRQLNTYGFRKVDPDRWEFANEGFLRGQKHLLKNITRRKPVHGNPQQPQQPNGQSSTINACVEVGKFGLEEEVERLKRDKNVLMQELVRLRQQQQTTDAQLSAMVQRLQGMEQRQQQMMSFLAKAVNSPGFLAQFMPQPNDSGRRLTEGSKKRRLKQDNVSHDVPVGPTDSQIIKYQPLMNEAAKAMLSQIIKLGSSPGMENFQNASENGFLIGDGSSESIAMNCGSSSNCVSGVTLQEVSPACGPPFLTSGAAFSEVQSPFLDVASADIATNVPVSPPDAIIMPELSGMVPETNVVGIMGSGTDNGIFLDPSGEIPLELSGISPDRDMEWDNSLLDDIVPELPEVGDPFWEKFLKSPTQVETEMDSIETDELRDRTEMKPLENGWEKSQQVAELTEQMGHLSSDTKKEENFNW